MSFTLVRESNAFTCYVIQFHVVVVLEAKVDENLRHLNHDCERLENYVRKEPLQTRQQAK